MKSKIVRNIFLLLLVLLLIAVGAFFFYRKQVDPIAPVRTKLDSTLSVPLSELIFPVNFEVRELNDLLNTAISGKFFSAALNVNERGDIVELDVSKSAALEINWQMPYLEMEVPLHLSGIGRVKVGKTKVSNKEPIEGDLILKLRSEIAISADWKLITKTTIKEIIWVNDPYVKILFLKFNLKKKVDEAIKAREAELVKSFDKAIGEKIELKKAITRIWMDIQKPIRVNKKEVLVYLRSRCESISGRMINKGPKIICIQVACYTKTQLLFDNDTSFVINDRLPSYTKSTKGMKDKVELFIAATIPFELANKKMNERINDLQLHYEQFSVKIKHIELYGTDSAIAMKVNVRGDIKGDIYLTGNVFYDALTNEIGINELKYDVSTENILLQSADWIFQDSLPGMIEKKLRVPIDSLTNKLPFLMSKGIEDSKVGKKLDAEITIESIGLNQILITRKDIQIIAIARAKAAIDLDKRAFSKNIKPIRITKVNGK